LTRLPANAAAARPSTPCINCSATTRLEFLNALHGRWNISLFHYRNHGAAYGRVLCGLQVPPRERAACRRTLDALAYDYSLETANPAYDLFLGTK
jgi:threonine dehydratase